MTAKRAPQKNITIADVAREAGVSKATVSRVINGSDLVIPATTERVRAAIRRLGYIPQAAARNLARSRTNTLGLLMRSIGNDFAAEILRGVEAYTFHSDYNLLITSRHVDDDGDLMLPALGRQNTDGLIVMTGCLPPAEISELHRLGFPLLLLYELPPDGLPIPSIHVENRAGTRQLIDHMIEVHGCRRFGFLRGPENNLDSEQREAGLRESLAAHGLQLDPTLIGFGNYQESQSYHTVRQWAAEGREMDAIFGGSDEGAIGAVMALKDAGVAIPDEIAVVGFDDLNHSHYVTPALTTVRAPTEQVGRLAVERMIEILEGRPVVQTTLLPTDLVIRRSCGC